MELCVYLVLQISNYDVRLILLLIFMSGIQWSFANLSVKMLDIGLIQQDMHTIKFQIS